MGELTNWLLHRYNTLAEDFAENRKLLDVPNQEQRHYDYLASERTRLMEIEGIRWYMLPKEVRDATTRHRA